VGAMKSLVTVSADEAKKHFLKGSSYFNNDIPDYISFEPILNDVNKVLGGKGYAGFKSKDPKDYPGVNYSLVANKDGRFAWRPFELFHPAIYVSLVDIICEPTNWAQITARLQEFKNGAVDCCSLPVISVDNQSDQASQVRSWWQKVEQKAIKYSLEFSHVLHTDVTDCYGSLYTHSISWALHGQNIAKKNRNSSLIGNNIDNHIQASRYGQTNGISQGSVLMDFIAEIVLGYVDLKITDEIDSEPEDFRILRYRDDYRIFTNSDDLAEKILKVVSDKLRDVGMRLSVAKTFVSTNVVESSIKQDKLAGIDLQDLGKTNAETIQKQLLRLHAFGRRFPNSGALRRLLSGMHKDILKVKDPPVDLEVQVAIATDIAVVSPQAFPAIAGILSHLISLAPKDKKNLWSKVVKKMRRVPYNGYLEIWLQRVTMPKPVEMDFDSIEPICQIVNGNAKKLWENDWIAYKVLKGALDVSKIVVGQVSEKEEVVKPKEVELFNNNAWAY
jgi:hypothetical protein